jgi:hypothetical protein
MADGGAQPTRRIEGQGSKLGRTMHGIAYDPVHDEFMVPQLFAQAIMTFRGGADGEEPPVRMIQGSDTQLRQPDRPFMGLAECVLCPLALGDVPDVALNHFMMINQIDITDKFHRHGPPISCLKRQVFIANISSGLQF